MEQGNFYENPSGVFPRLRRLYQKSLGLFKLSPHLFGQYYNLGLPQNQSGKTDVLVGAFMFLRKQLYDQLEGFDENFFMYGEDIDISHRSLKLGLINFYLSEAKVIHFKGRARPKTKPMKNDFSMRCPTTTTKKFFSQLAFELCIYVWILHV